MFRVKADFFVPQNLSFYSREEPKERKEELTRVYRNNPPELRFVVMYLIRPESAIRGEGIMIRSKRTDPYFHRD